MRRSGIHPSHMSEHDMRRMNLSDDLDAEPSEYCWGAGLEPPSVRGASPAQGGRYRGREATEDYPRPREVNLSRDPRV
ncbi:hypothetical protein MTOK_24700 [Mycolicibacterium tokaiense]|nr:hypothetical protein MTOK_24700 [Mycolicibacterium tokaiense]